MVQKMSADYNLATEQFLTLNKEFYDNYPSEYFLTKLYETTLRIAQPDLVMPVLEGAEIEIGKMRTVFPVVDPSQVCTYAKIELYELYIHCLESFFRLFIARAKRSGCEWLEMNRLTTKKYHEALEKIADGRFSWLNDSLEENMVVQYTLTGHDLPTEEIDVAVIENWKKWISYCAVELQNIKAYNSYKHGLTLHTKHGGISFQSESSNESLEKHGDVITYLERGEQSERFVWRKTTEFLDLDVLSFKFFIFANLIFDMIQVGKYEYLGSEIQERWYPNEKLTLDILYKKEDKHTSIASCVDVSSFSMTLLYYSDHKASKQ